MALVGKVGIILQAELFHDLSAKHFCTIHIMKEVYFWISFFAEGNKRKMECIQEWFLDHIQVIDSLPIMILLIGRYMA